MFIKNIVKTLCVASISTLLLVGCQTTPMSFGVPTTQFKKMTPSQRQDQIKNYNAEQANKAKEAPLWNALGAIAGAVSSAHPASTKHCHNQSINPVCHTNPDGSRTCTGSSSGSCSGFSID